MAAWQRTSNYGWWQSCNDGTDNNDSKTAINKCAEAEAEDNNGWQEAMDEQQWHSRQAMGVNGKGQWQLSWQDDSGGSTTTRRRRINHGKAKEDELYRARWWRLRGDCCVAAEEKLFCNKVMEDGGGRRVGIQSYLESYLNESCPKLG